MHRSVLLILTLVAVLALPQAAQASPAAIYADCEDNARLDGRHSDADLRAALRDIPQDIDEYSNCRELISDALDGVDTTGNAGGSLPSGLNAGNGVGSVPLGPDGKPLDPLIDAQPDERADVKSAAAGIDVKPSAGGVRPGEPDGELPLPLIIALALAAAATVAAAAPRLIRLVHARTA